MQSRAALEWSRGDLVQVLPLFLSCPWCWKNHLVPVVSNFLRSQTRRLEQIVSSRSLSAVTSHNLPIYYFTDCKTIWLVLTPTCLWGLSDWLHTYTSLKLYIFCPYWAITWSTKKKGLSYLLEPCCAIRQPFVTWGYLHRNMFFHYMSHISSAPQPRVASGNRIGEQRHRTLSSSQKLSLDSPAIRRKIVSEWETNSSSPSQTDKRWWFSKVLSPISKQSFGGAELKASQGPV